jgi:hypothetical protein
MIPRKEILKQINRFYDLLESIDNQIEQKQDKADFELLKAYFELTSKVGPEMMYAIDSLKNKLDIIENDTNQ